MFGDAWNSVAATWDYLIAMPQSAATGLHLSTTIVVVIGLLIWMFKRSINLFILVGPLILVGIAYAFLLFGQWADVNFFIQLMKITSLFAFLWAVVALFLTLFTQKRKVKV